MSRTQSERAVCNNPRRRQGGMEFENENIPELIRTSQPKSAQRAGRHDKREYGRTLRLRGPKQRGGCRDGDVVRKMEVGVSTWRPGKRQWKWGNGGGGGRGMECACGVMRNKINKDKNENEERYTYRYSTAAVAKAVVPSFQRLEKSRRARQCRKNGLYKGREGEVQRSRDLSVAPHGDKSAP
ncbi:hypothetical protein B0H13DRAFT_1903350 [Mycena leptocephala]|nr:hypothetical protein B0H13DRAFT_1903350 [Mycena leptocephala]